MSNKPSQKFCSQCGASNKRTAKVCVQCGHHFNMTSESSVQLAETEKSCPECGTINKLTAKVCIQCGHHFRTQFTGSEKTEPATKIGELPITQNPQPAVNLPPEFDLPSTPDLPPVSGPDVSTANSLEGEPAPDISSIELGQLREEASPHERLQRSLQRKQQKP